MTFGWEGFSLEHPEDWSPIVLGGNREQGYARIASPIRTMLQIRWRRLKPPARADEFLDHYLGRLKRDAKRSGVSFSCVREPKDGRIAYRYAGAVTGRGIVFDATDGRMFVMEAVSAKGDAIVPVLHGAVNTFRTDDGRDRWSVFGLDVTIPTGLRLESKSFLAGKTVLRWRAPGVQIHAERWGLAHQLLAKHALSDWAAALLRARKPMIASEGPGLRLEIPGRWPASPSSALVRHQVERNQIVVLRASSRSPRWRPEWDWLN